MGQSEYLDQMLGAMREVADTLAEDIWSEAVGHGKNGLSRGHTSV